MASDFAPISPVDRVCQVGVPYTVNVQNDQATFDLSLEPGVRYRVIVGSVASQETQSTITLSAERIPGIERFPLLPSPVLQSANPKNLPIAKEEAWNPPNAASFASRMGSSNSPTS